ncbi:tryptophan synthase subunit beta like protein [Arsukibacterium sp.]|uniref:tryptophan synthase subunit beta like protein n=1 Tax=Arsukibacterium sp. TaxID=1977258 RepID=UPI002FD94067
MFVKRDQHGEICAVSLHQTADCAEFIDDKAADLIEFCQRHFADTQQNNTKEHPGRQLQISDADLARVLEDVIDALSIKGILAFTDLPLAAQQKLLQRKHLRKNLTSLELISDDDDSFMP